MKSGSGGLNLVPKDRGKSFLEKITESFANKLQSLFNHSKKSIDFSLLTHRIPPEVVGRLRQINSIAIVEESDDFQVEGRGRSGSGGICQRVIYKAKYIFVIKKIDMINFRDRDYLRLQRELDIHSSLNNRRIPTLYHSFHESNAMYLIMQYGGEDIFNQAIAQKDDIVNV